ncbi:MAG: DUF2855 family protein [Pseudomonadota bacterium]
MALQHLISKTDLRDTKWADIPDRDLAAGEVRLRVDAFALTANNVTYAAFGGPPMNYWSFYPSDEAGFGRVPVWGFATVIASRADEVAEGRRVYGYLPMSETFTIEAAKISPRGFMDGIAHRRPLAPIYSSYVYNEGDPGYVSEFEAQQMLFRPLYMTGWMICDSLVSAEAVPKAAILSSASSKTALAAAHSLKRHGVETWGLTSTGNRGFVEKSDLYDHILTYDDLDGLGQMGDGMTAAYVDFVGRPDLTKTIHSALGVKLIRSMVIGVTDWEADRTPPPDLPGPMPEFFFVPDYAAQRAKAFAPGDLDKRTTADLLDFYPASQRFVTPQDVIGPDAIDTAWHETVDAKIGPKDGLICRFVAGL